MINTILFDLDGTLLPMDQDSFTKTYFANLSKAMAAFHGSEELIRAVWAGTKGMIKNDGSKTNEAAFWDIYAGIFGEEARKEEPYFAEFYEKSFSLAADKCRKNEDVPKLIKSLKEAGYKLAVATNPVFPMTAQLQRIQWAGLDPEDFQWITSYENSSFCKPNPDYYRMILEQIGASAEEAMMVGNDVQEDMAASRLGMEVFLITDCMINSENRDLSDIPHGDFAALRRCLQSTGFRPLSD